VALKFYQKKFEQASIQKHLQLTLNKCTLNKNSINVIKSLINVLSQHFGMLLDINEEKTYHDEEKRNKK
jgi:hypothetical protein